MDVGFVASEHKTLNAFMVPILLICSILGGGLAGYLLGPKAQYLKPWGDVFLNLIFTAIVPLIFFSVSSAIARSGSIGILGKIMGSMTVVFVLTSAVAALYSIFVVKMFPPAQGINLQLALAEKIAQPNFSNQIAGIFTVSDFSQLLSHQHILALIVFSILVGLAVSSAKEKGVLFADFLRSGEDIMMRVFMLIMYYAPVGFFCYFAVLVSDLGPKLLENYARIALLYYASVLVYFMIAYTFFAYLAGKIQGVRIFWKNIFLPMITALATCSSAASIPANLVACRGMRVPSEIYETTIPLGTIIHKDGSVMGGVFKIAFLFGICHFDFSGTAVLLTAFAVSLLVGTVMGAIPSGGMLGELLILNVYGFPPSVLIAIAAISIIIDPIATMLNVTGNSVSSMLIARMVEGRRWLVKTNP